MIVRLVAAAIFMLSFVNGNVSCIQCHSSADDPICDMSSISPSNRSICIHFYYKDVYTTGNIISRQDHGCFYKSACGTTDFQKYYDPDTGALDYTEEIYADCGFIRNGGWWVFVFFPLLFGAIAIGSVVGIMLIKKKEHKKKKSDRWGTTKENNPLPICKAAWVDITESQALLCFILNIIWPGFGTFVSSFLDSEGCNMTAFVTSLLQSLLGGLAVGWVWSIAHGYFLYTGSKGKSSVEDDEESDRSSRSGKKVLLDGNLAKTTSSLGEADSSHHHKHEKSKGKSKKDKKKEEKKMKEKQKKEAAE
jgi:hypothetical protein